MFCQKCGNTIAEGEMFCASCGAKVEQPAAQPANNVPPQQPVNNAQPQQPANGTVQNTVPKPPIDFSGAGEKIGAAGEKIGEAAQSAAKTFSGMPKTTQYILIGAVAAVVLVIIIIIVAVAAGGGSRYTAYPDFNPSISADGSTYYFNGTTKLKAIEDQSDSDSNLIGTTFAYNEDELYMIKGGKMEKIDSGEIRYMTVATMADVVYYIKDDDNLCVYNGSVKKVASIDEDSSFSSLVVSPNGSACAWMETEYDDGDRKVSVYGYKGGEAKKLGKVDELYSISNGAGIIYACKSDKLAVSKNLSEEFETIRGCDSALATSADNSQILFASNSKTYLYYPSLQDAILVRSGMMIPFGGSKNYYSANNFDNFLAIDTYGTPALYYLRRKGSEYEYSQVAKFDNLYSAFDVTLSSDGKYVLYIKDRKLYKKKVDDENAESILIARDVSSYQSNDTLTSIYIISSDDGSLRWSSGKEDDTKSICNDTVSDMHVYKNGVCTFIYDGILAYSVNGGDKQKISVVSEAKRFGSSSYFVYDEDDEIYITADGKNFTKTGVAG